MRSKLLALLLLATGWARAQDPLVGYEYWFDQADADNERIFVGQTPQNELDLGNEAIPASTLGLGQHRIHYRLKDCSGEWSSVLYRAFSVFETGPFELVSGEYWFDEDDQNRVVFPVTPGQAIDLTISPDASALGIGQHRIHYRLRDDHGYWSSVLYNTFNVHSAGPFELVLMRYWSDPAYQTPTDMTEVAINPSVSFWETANDILFCDWSTTGNTEVFFQIKDDHGQWSSVISASIDVDAVTGAPIAPSLPVGPGSVDPNMSYDYTVTPVAGAGGYTWLLPNGWTGNSTGNSITVQTPGTIPGIDSIGVAAYNGCGASDTTWLVLLATGLDPGSFNQHVRLFPNPTNGESWIVNEGSTAIDRILMLNSMGQVIYDERPTSTDRYTLDLSNAANGLYTVRISQGTNTTTLPVMVQH
ncbi:MAG: T9SS type A sorting domain-containing protein [Flavobacteriales bacterium]|nr:T9SS type A sorting domain-containing protein [Flavobacteriales bacterium]